MRVLCFALPERGHLNPLLPTLRRLAEAGHDVVICAVVDLADVVAAAGFQARTRVLSSVAVSERVTAGAEFAERLRDPTWLAAWIEALLIDGVPALVPVIAAHLEVERPDVVVLDPMFYAAVVACEKARVPWAAVSSSLNPVTPSSWSTDLTRTLDALSERRRRLFADRGLAPPLFRVSDAISPWLTIAFSAPSIVGDSRDVHLVGATCDDDDIHHRGDETPFDASRLRVGPRLYVSFGSQAFFQPRLFARVFALAEARGFQVIASVGDLVDDDVFMAAVPADAVVGRYLPQLEVLKHVDIVVSHGGANSAVESLRAGRPLLVLPLCNDQPLQARFVVAAGVGAAVDASSGDVDAVELAAAFDAAIAATPKARAAAIVLRDAGGPRRAAALITTLGQSRQPVPVPVP